MGGFIVAIIYGRIPLWIPLSSCVQHLVVSWQQEFSLFVWKPSSSRKCYNFLQKDLLVSSLLLRWPTNERLYCQFN